MGLIRTRPVGEYQDTRPAMTGAQAPAPASTQWDAIHGLAPARTAGGRAGAGEEERAGLVNDRTARLLVQHLNYSQRLETDDSKNVEGTLGHLKKTEPRLAVYIARGFNQFTIALCPGLLGRELYEAARRGETVAG